jgi:hypothetical protein
LTGTNGTHTGEATFASGSLLDFNFNHGAQVETWTIMSAAGGITDNGLTFAEGVDTDILTFAVVHRVGALMMIAHRRRQ